MKPIGLLFKDYSVNPFTNRGNGELMIVHLCLSCESLSPNRIAGDDNEVQLVKLLEESDLNDKTRLILTKRGLNLLTVSDKKEVMNNLFGYRH